MAFSNANVIKPMTYNNGEPEDSETATVRYKPESLETLRSLTRFSAQELKAIYRGFKQDCPTGVVNEEAFKEIFSQFFPQGDASAYARHIFRTLDKSRAGHITFQQFIVALSMLARGSPGEKVEWTFALYDVDGDGVITERDLHTIVRAIYDLMGVHTTPQLTESTPDEHADRLFQKLDHEHKGFIAKEEFIEYYLKDEGMQRSMQLFDTVL